MLVELVHEPDIFITTLQYLPYHSVARLLRTSYAIHDFIDENQRRIRSSIEVNFHFHLFGSQDAIRLNPDSNTPKIVIYIDQVESDLNTVMQGIEIKNGITLSKNKKGLSIEIVDTINLRAALKHLWTYFLSDFRFQSIEVNLDEQLLWCFGQLCDYLKEARTTVDKIVFEDHFPPEKELKSIVRSLRLRHLDLQCELRPSREFGCGALTADFFRGTSNLRELFAPKTDCDVGDEELANFDVLAISGESSRITFDGLYNWMRFKLEHGPLRSKFSCENLSFVAELEQRICMEYSKDGDFFFRNRDGRWIFFEISNNLTWIEICPSYAEHFPGSEKDNFDVSIDIPLDGGQTIKMSQQVFRCHFRFNVVTELPESGMAVLVDRLTDDAAVYEIGHSKFIIFVKKEDESLEEESLSETLKAFGSRLRYKQFDRLSCKGKSSLRLLLAIRQGSPSHLSIKDLTVHDTSDALLPVIQSFNVEHLQCDGMSLSKDFFSNTPSLTSLDFYSGNTPDCKLEITNETLQRFHRLVTNEAKTWISVVGLRNWIQKRLNDESDEILYGKFEIRIRNPTSFSPKELVTRLTQNMKGEPTQGRPLTFVFKDNGHEMHLSVTRDNDDHFDTICLRRMAGGASNRFW